MPGCRSLRRDVHRQHDGLCHRGTPSPTSRRPLFGNLQLYRSHTLLLLQAMGMTLPYSSSIPAEDPLKRDECRMAGQALLNLMQKDIKPRDIMV